MDEAGCAHVLRDLAQRYGSARGIRRDNAGPDEVEGSGEARTHKLQLDGAAETSALALSSLEKPSVAHPARKKEDVLEVRVEAAMVIAGRLEELEGGRVRGRSPSAWSTPQRLKRLAYKACWCIVSRPHRAGSGGEAG